MRSKMRLPQRKHYKSRLDNRAWRHFKEILEKIQSEQLSFQSPIIDRWKIASTRKKSWKFSRSYVFVRTENQKMRKNAHWLEQFFAKHTNNVSKIWNIHLYDFSGFSFIWSNIFTLIDVNDFQHVVILASRHSPQNSKLACRHAVTIP